MSQVNPIITTPEEQFVVGESDFAFFDNYACRIEGGAFLFCRSGSAQASVNQYQGEVRRNTMVLLLPGSILLLTDRTEDFRGDILRFFARSFRRGGVPSGPFVLPYPGRAAISYPPARVVRRGCDLVPDGGYTYRDRNNVFRNTIIKTVCKRAAGELRQDAALRRTAAADARGHHAADRSFPAFRGPRARILLAGTRVAFYADKLCISTRYLSTIVRAWRGVRPRSSSTGR